MVAVLEIKNVARLIAISVIQRRYQRLIATAVSLFLVRQQHKLKYIKMKSYQVDENGFYGEFGGAYVPEIL